MIRLLIPMVASLMLTVPSWAAASDEPVVYAPRNLAKLIEAGKGTITSGKIDIGRAEDAIDGNPKTLVRSASVNPFEITLVLDDPIEVPMMRVRFSSDVHIWTVEAADTKGDLENKSGSYATCVDHRRVEDGSFDSVTFDRPVRARAFRLTVERITGDDYVHVFDWEYPAPSSVEDFEISVLGYRPRDENWRQAEQVYENTVVTLKAFVTPEGGERMEITPEVAWRVDGEPWRGEPGRYLLTKTGQVEVQAEYAGMKKTRTLTVIPLPKENMERDLDVLHIERLPRLDYDGTNGGWPEDGSIVTWRAHVRNWGSERFDSVPCEFRMNDGVVLEGTIDDFEPETTRTIDWQSTWHKSRQRIAFIVDPKDEIDESSEANNRVEDFTDALAVGFYVEERLWRYMHDTQRQLHIGSNGFEDWAQRQMGEWNRLHADAVYVSCPQGVLDRVRLDRIVVVPNNALPLAGGIATNNPNNDDKTVDLIWGFESVDLDGGGWQPVVLDDNNASYISWGHIHELNHARYIVDHYGFDVHPGQVHILDDDGKPIAGGAQFPEGALHYNKYKGLMGGPHVYDEYMALAWNRIAGRRAREGNYNSPGVIGEYLQLFPERNTFTFVDGQGSPLAGGEVWVYRAEGNGKDWYGKDFDNTPDAEFTLDAGGRCEMPRTIFSEDGKIVHTFGKANSVVILKVAYEDRTRYEFLECSDFNVEYMRGHTEHGHYVITVPFQPSGAGRSQDSPDASGRYGGGATSKIAKPFSPTLAVNVRMPFSIQRPRSCFEASRPLTSSVVSCSGPDHFSHSSDARAVKYRRPFSVG
jgi:hypothetical protein